LDKKISEGLSGTNPSLYVKRNRDLMTKLLRDIWYNHVMWKPGTSYPTPPINADNSNYEPDLLNLWCEGPVKAHKQLIKISNLVHLILQNVNYLVLAVLKNEYRFPTVSPLCHVNNIYGLCP
jgi:hypothetical protein